MTDEPKDPAPGTGIARERERLAKIRAGGSKTLAELEADRLKKERDRLEAINRGAGPLKVAIERRGRSKALDILRGRER